MKPAKLIFLNISGVYLDISNKSFTTSKTQADFAN